VDAGAVVVALDRVEAWDDEMEDAISSMSIPRVDIEASGLADDVVDSSIDSTWRAICDALDGPPNTLYLGRWYGFVAFGIGRALVRRLASAGGRRELIVEEYELATSDHALRWAYHWVSDDASDVDLAVLRGPGSPVPATPPDPYRGRVAAWLVNAGWVPATLAEADHVADERRRTGVDPLAGSRWVEIGAGNLDTGTCVVGDAQEITAATPWNDRPLVEGDALDLRPYGLPAVAVHCPDGDLPYGVSIPLDDEPPHAVRIDWDNNAFDLAEAYDHVATIEIASGRLAITDPAYIADGGPEVVVDVTPGSWIVETIHEMRDKAGFRLRRVPGD
jgi:hypothetical protein